MKRQPTGIPEGLVRKAHKWQTEKRYALKDAADHFGLDYRDFKYDMKRLGLKAARILARNRPGEDGLPKPAQSKVDPVDIDFVRQFRAQIRVWDRERSMRMRNDV